MEKADHEVADVVQNTETLIEKLSGVQKPPPMLAGMILLVEDDEYIARVYDRAFRLAGFTLYTCPDGEAALQVLSGSDAPPLAILLDLTLPKLGGEELFKNIRVDARYKSVPIVILTNSFRKEDEGHLLSLGAELFLVKVENTPGQIVEKVIALINKSSHLAAV